MFANPPILFRLVARVILVLALSANLAAVSAAPENGDVLEMSGFVVILPDRQVFTDDESKDDLKLKSFPPDMQAQYAKLTEGKLPGQKTFVTLKGRVFPDKSLEVTEFMSLAIDRPRKVATAARIEGASDGRPGRVIGTINGKDDVLADAGFSAWVVDEGRTILFSAPGSGGYENEGQTLMKVVLTCDCKPKKVVEENFLIRNVREVFDASSRSVWVLEMSDGGAGIGRVAVVDPMRSMVVYRKDGAKVLEAADGKLTLGLYEGEGPWADLSAGKPVEPATREVVDIARERRSAVPTVTNRR